MVCVNPPSDGGGGALLPSPRQQPQQQQQQQVQVSSGGLGMALPGTVTSPTAAEDLSKKVRKPYTITKSRESWTEQEHDKFLEALQLFDRDWKKIEAFVGSKTVIQIRSHAQKYFLKVQKNGTSEHVPPPRPKRKAAHPYPQKASKNTPLLSQPPIPLQGSSCLIEPGFATMSSWAHSSVQPIVASFAVKEDGGVGELGTNNNSSSSTNDQINQVASLRGRPDFAQVYGFLGSIFDPSTSGHLQKLKEMDPIDVEAALLLMRNLSLNLTSPEFEDHRKLLSAYDDSNEIGLGPAESIFQPDRPMSPVPI
ncbi:Homeodomain-like superfamily protein [Rhynchospora pubera]|uniref:Homeodomain-like superfamily protein n=2 Tax=Rhynchospora pubera TaxID=906938 RepID=A0AAV8BTQ0_9POAL|nr:Homeodomain-like superfamily protein [Rhynchospora pubera]